jgi:hypothetical protein
MHLELHLVHAFDCLVLPEPIDLVLTIIEEHWTSWPLAFSAFAYQPPFGL